VQTPQPAVSVMQRVIRGPEAQMSVQRRTQVGMCGGDVATEQIGVPALRQVRGDAFLRLGALGQFQALVR